MKIKYLLLCGIIISYAKLYTAHEQSNIKLNPLAALIQEQQSALTQRQEAESGQRARYGFAQTLQQTTFNQITMSLQHLVKALNVAKAVQTNIQALEREKISNEVKLAALKQATKRMERVYPQANDCIQVAQDQLTSYKSLPQHLPFPEAEKIIEFAQDCLKQLTTFNNQITQLFQQAIAESDNHTTDFKPENNDNTSMLVHEQSLVFNPVDEQEPQSPTDPSPDLQLPGIIMPEDIASEPKATQEPMTSSFWDLSWKEKWKYIKEEFLPLDRIKNAYETFKAKFLDSWQKTQRFFSNLGN